MAVEEFIGKGCIKGTSKPIGRDFRKPNLTMQLCANTIEEVFLCVSSFTYLSLSQKVEGYKVRKLDILQSNSVHIKVQMKLASHTK